MLPHRTPMLPHWVPMLPHRMSISFNVASILKVDVDIYHIKCIWSNFDNRNTYTFCCKLDFKMLRLSDTNVEETLTSDEYVSLFLIPILNIYIWNLNIYIPIRVIFKEKCANCYSDKITQVKMSWIIFFPSNLVIRTVVKSNRVASMLTWLAPHRSP